MGYDSNFNLRVLGKTPEERMAVIDEIQKKSGYRLSDRTDDGAETSASLYEAHWYDYCKDILAVTRRHPGVTVEVEREGEERNDNVIDRFRGDDCESVTMEYCWPPFKDILLPGEKAAEPEKDVRKAFLAAVEAAKEAVTGFIHGAVSALPGRSLDLGGKEVLLETVDPITDEVMAAPFRALSVFLEPDGGTPLVALEDAGGGREEDYVRDFSLGDLERIARLVEETLAPAART